MQPLQMNLYTSLQAGDVITVHGLRNVTLIDGSESGELELEDASVIAPQACPVYTHLCQIDDDATNDVTCPDELYSCAKYFASIAFSSNLTNGSSGFFGSSRADTSAVLQHQDVANVSLSGSALYDEADRLLLYVVSQAPASNVFRVNQISVSFRIRNPPAAQPSPRIDIEIEGPNSFAPIREMAKRPQYNEQKVFPYKPATTTYNTAPLLISGFIEMIIYQRTPSSGVDNTVTLILMSYIDLEGSANGTIEITGFRTPPQAYTPPQIANKTSNSSAQVLTAMISGGLFDIEYVHDAALTADEREEMVSRVLCLEGRVRGEQCEQGEGKLRGR